MRRHARAADTLSRLSGSIQCPVTPMNALSRADQQSVVVATHATDCVAANSCLFISTTLAFIRVFAVSRHITDLSGRRRVTNAFPEGMLTNLKGSNPSTMTFMIRLSTVCCDTLARCIASRVGHK